LVWVMLKFKAVEDMDAKIKCLIVWNKSGPDY
jgi:hypothetical protein